MCTTNGIEKADDDEEVARALTSLLVPLEEDHDRRVFCHTRVSPIKECWRLRPQQTHAIIATEKRKKEAGSIDVENSKEKHKKKNRKTTKEEDDRTRKIAFLGISSLKFLPLFRVVWSNCSNSFLFHSTQCPRGFCCMCNMPIIVYKQ